MLETFQFTDSQKQGVQQVVMNGNEAIGYGLIAAGVRFGAGYPITPWTDIMELLRRELPKYGGSFIQCEDEIASVSMALGASFAGRVAVTGSSGPGIALKTEAIGWAVMAEMPLVVINVQRGGPSTGMPTNIEQSDLNIAINGGHGDAPRVVLAPANVEDCFYMAIEAVNIARKYNTPVFFLTDQGIATRIEAFPEPDLEKVCQDITPDFTPVAVAQALRLGREGRRHASTSSRARGFSTANIPSPPASNTTNTAIRAARRKSTCCRTPNAAKNCRRSARRCRCRKFTARRKAMFCSSAGVPPKARSAKPWTVSAPPATAFPRFICATSTRCRTGWKIFSPASTTFSSWK